ncbi:hypothetical protein EYF80_059234 [Liparis tanakae]|uniref:Uncharacterized protein n=1 Tax=Liparis tanakae TaxID=230148 RepID=A0A4Z2EQG8_9TELE|nr:hypothetical protein EYF80_059234 [Liparis tanakae]
MKKSKNGALAPSAPRSCSDSGILFGGGRKAV